MRLQHSSVLCLPRCAAVCLTLSLPKHLHCRCLPLPVGLEEMPSEPKHSVGKFHSTDDTLKIKTHTMTYIEAYGERLIGL